MQALASEARALQSRPALRYDDAVRALESSVKQGLGAGARLSIVGERATVTLKSVPATALAPWLSQARVNARALPVEVRLVRGAPSGNGSTGVRPGMARWCWPCPCARTHHEPCPAPRHCPAGTPLALGLGRCGRPAGADLHRHPAGTSPLAGQRAGSGLSRPGRAVRARGTCLEWVSPGCCSLAVQAAVTPSALPGRVNWQIRPTGQGAASTWIGADCCTREPVALNLTPPHWGGARLQVLDSPAGTTLARRPADRAGCPPGTRCRSKGIWASSPGACP